jgi:hypothetical protein
MGLPTQVSRTAYGPRCTFVLPSDVLMKFGVGRKSLGCLKVNKIKMLQLPGYNNFRTNENFPIVSVFMERLYFALY